MKIIILGGDGFCGWPTTLYLSKKGHDVMIVDNLSRRFIDHTLQTESLTPISSPEARVDCWKDKMGKKIRFKQINIANEYNQILLLLRHFKPNAIVHFAEQRSAPYSMKSSETRRYTVDNNVNATHNVLSALIESELDIHLIHLGTMGVYGYNGEVPEGYIDFEGRKVLYPSAPGSIYHTTKVMDQWLFYFYNKNYGVRITDLHQGIVWGTQTDETALDELLINRFDYDGDFGTVLNRFLMQAAVGHPITVYGTGQQKRAFIHIKDTVECIRLALLHPPQKGEMVKIVNQYTEIYHLRDLAKMISEMTGAKIQYCDNPRKEKEDNELNTLNENIQKWGLYPITLQGGLMQEIIETAQKYKNRCDVSKIMPSSFW